MNCTLYNAFHKHIVPRIIYNQPAHNENQSRIIISRIDHFRIRSTPKRYGFASNWVESKYNKNGFHFINSMWDFFPSIWARQTQPIIRRLNSVERLFFASLSLLLAIKYLNKIASYQHSIGCLQQLICSIVIMNIDLIWLKIATTQTRVQFDISKLHNFLLRIPFRPLDNKTIMRESPQYIYLYMSHLWRVRTKNQCAHEKCHEQPSRFI